MLLTIIMSMMMLASPDYQVIAGYIQSENLNSLSAHFDEYVEVSIQDDEDLYSASEAKAVVGKFFNKTDINSVEIKHKGISKNGDGHYAIGDMSTDQGEFRLFLYLAEKDSKYLIEELRIESP